MRASRLLVLAVLGAVMSCANPGSPPQDVLFLRAGSGITLVRDLPQADTVTLPRAVPSVDWSAVVHSERQEGGTTRVVAVEASSARELWSRDLPGRLEVRAASAGGNLVALGPPRERSGYAYGRDSTTLVIAGLHSEPWTIELEGNYQPEAFSLDNQSLFVVEYLPPLRPDSYRVRRLDLRTGEVVGVYTPDEDLQTAMQGTARIQASSRDGRRLYTLYTVDGPGGTSRAFIHVLALDELWAHCIDLPPEFASPRETSLAIALSQDGTRLFVADTKSANIARIDTATLSVQDTRSFAAPDEDGATHLAAAPDGEVYLAKGSQVEAFNGATLESTASWEFGGRITGLQPSREGASLYVGLRSRIAVLDTAVGEILPTPAADDLGVIDQLGESTRVLDEVRTTFECAC